MYEACAGSWGKGTKKPKINKTRGSALSLHLEGAISHLHKFSRAMKLVIIIFLSSIWKH